MANSEIEFQRLLDEFVRDLEEALSLFSDEPVLFTAAELEGKVQLKLKQEDSSPGRVRLRANGEVLLGLSIKFDCTWDSKRSYLAIENSSFEVWPLARKRGEPLFRIDYVREQNSHFPASHFHVHGHRDEFTHLSGHAGLESRPSRKRVERGVTMIPSLSEFHFSTGGPRFRPSLEDLLETLRVEFGLDVDQSKWQCQLKKSRAKWRKIQTAAAVRDSPQTAVDVLVEEHGLVIPEGWEPLSDNKKKLFQS